MERVVNTSIALARCLIEDFKVKQILVPLLASLIICNSFDDSPHRRLHSDLQLEHQYVFASSSFKLLEVRLIFLLHPHVLILTFTHVDQFLEVVVLYLE